jgi:hypothetical protein
MLCVLLMLPRSLEVAEEEMTKDLTAIAMMMTYKNGDAAAPLIVTTNQHA